MAGEAGAPREWAAPGTATEASPVVEEEEGTSDRMVSRKGWSLRLTKQPGGAVTAVEVAGAALSR